MAVKLEQLYYNIHGDRVDKDHPEAQRCNILLTIGSMDTEDKSYEFNQAQFDLLSIAVRFWKYERDKGNQAESVLVQDNGWSHVKKAAAKDDI